jgi:DNA-binding NarL/FixJ family response regulator
VRTRGRSRALPRPDTIRVVVVDDHPLIRDFVRFACRAGEGVEVIAEASRGEEALDACRTLRPDVVVLDLVIPGMNGFEVARRLREERIPVRILVLSGSDQPEALFRCRRIGVDGYLEKTSRLTEVVDAIRAVAHGAWTFNSEQERSLHRQLHDLVRRSRETRRLTDLLTLRQTEVLGLVGEGLSTRQVASRLKISQRTAEAHIAKVYRKLGARTRLQAVTRAARLGLIDAANGNDRTA